MIYLDWAATAPLCKEAADAMRPYLETGSHAFPLQANANALYTAGREAFRNLEASRRLVAQALDARPDEIIFTSGATEADNAALFGLVDACMMQAEHTGGHCVPQVIVSSIEHDAVLEAAKTLHQWGALVTLVDPDASGHITPEALEQVITDDAIVVSIMAVNNEIGSVMDVAALADVAHRHGALFHTDATQAWGKMPLSVKDWKVDALSVSSHKIGGPKGMGALYLKARTPFSAQIVGGGQESKRRSGTQNVCGAVGFAAAAKRLVDHAEQDASIMRTLRDYCYEGLRKHEGVAPTVPCEAGSTAYAPHIVNVMVEGMESETLILQLDRRGFCVSGGSACSSHSLDPSHVLTALSLPRDKALGSLRVSMGPDTTKEDITAFLDAFAEVIQQRL